MGGGAGGGGLETQREAEVTIKYIGIGKISIWKERRIINNRLLMVKSQVY